MSLLMTLFGCGCTRLSPVSVELRYNADAQRIARAESLASIRIGVARFRDARARQPDDIHAESYVAENDAYRIGVSWGGRTFAPTVEVVQELLARELRHAGLMVEMVDAVVGRDDGELAKAAANGSQSDLILGGTLQELMARQQETPQRAVLLEVVLFEALGGNALLRMPFSDSQRGSDDAGPQRSVEELFTRSFKLVAHRIAAKVGEQVAKLADESSTTMVSDPAPLPSPTGEP
jgi:hypothetical protein